MMNKEELAEYSLKISAIAKFQEEANEYRKEAIFSGIVAGICTFLNINALYFQEGSSLIRFIGSLGYTSLTAFLLRYIKETIKKKKDCEATVLNLKKNIWM